MSTYEYEDYVRDQIKQQQAVLVTEKQIHEQKQQELRQIVYDELLKKYHLLQDESKAKDDKVKTLESIIMDYMEKENESRDRIFEISHDRMRRILLEKQFRSIFLCFDKENKLKWAKAPHEMNLDKGIPK